MLRLRPATPIARSRPPRARLDHLSFRLGALLGQPPLIDATFRLFSAGILPPAARKRFLFPGLAEEEVARTLRSIRSFADWPRAWTMAALRHERRARMAEAAGDRSGEVGRRWRDAALCHHFAQAASESGAAYARANAAKLAAFSRAAPRLDPPAEPVTIPWRVAPLPGYLRRPPGAHAGPLPLVALFNGAGNSKEELTLWSEPFLVRGLATLAFDSPGYGELRGKVGADLGQEDITTAILGWAVDHSALDAGRVALLGISFGGAQVVHHAAANPAVAACVAVTPPYHAVPYIDAVHPLVMAEVAAIYGLEAAAVRARVAGDSCAHVVEGVRCPTLVVGAGLDAVLPPSEARNLYDALRGPKTLLYFRRGTHISLSHIEQWTAAAADWLAARLGAEGR